MANILIMDDDLQLAHDLQMYLEADGHSVTICIDGASAMEALAAERFDLAIIDVFIRKQGKSVPDGGVLLAHRIRNAPELEQNSKIPIIGISGIRDQDGYYFGLDFARSSGANLSLKKPIKHADLKLAVEQLLGIPPAPTVSGKENIPLSDRRLALKRK